jgi:signal transduction histidine kinase
VETRALKPSRGRALYAALVLAFAFAALLAIWLVSGWRDLRARQREVTAAPTVAADQRAGELARELRGQLERLLVRESERLPFHYQNLFHDPRSSAPASLAPSPLAAGPDDPLVLGYFQIDDKAHVTTPTINDELPELSDARHLAENRAFREEVTHSLVAALAPERHVLVAAADPVVRRPRDPAVRKPVRTPVPDPVPEPVPDTQVLKLDGNTWTQNANPNANWKQQSFDNNLNNVIIEAPNATPKPEPVPAVNSAPPPVPTPRPATPAHPRPPDPRTSAPPDPPVVITLSPFEWRTFPFSGAPGLVAVRRVDTPDGRLAQGFVIDRATVTSWLATRAGEMVAKLEPSSGRNEIASGWQLAVTPNPRTIAAASLEATGLERAFLFRFAAATAISALAAVLVVLLVVRAERLARERSHFAAAAAHELRTPLAGLQLYGDMLADGLGDPAKLRDYAKRMSEEASRLGRVVSNVLGFSQLERGNLSVDAQVGPLGEALRELAERVEPTLDRAGAALALDVPPDVRARFDRDALARIIGNLLDNAEKYARDATDRTITLSAKDLGDTVEVSVTDHGPGIATRTRLFEPFRRGVTSDGPAGLGLGLALSRSLARAMGGELEHRAETATGTTFVLRLPRA